MSKKSKPSKQDQTNSALIRISAVTVIVLSIPMIAMQLSSEWDWGIADFVIIGALVFTTGLVFEFVVRKLKKPAHRVVFGLLLLLALLAVYGELAVGIFSTPLAGS